MHLPLIKERQPREIVFQKAIRTFLSKAIKSNASRES